MLVCTRPNLEACVSCSVSLLPTGLEIHFLHVHFRSRKAMNLGTGSIETFKVEKSNWLS